MNWPGAKLAYRRLRAPAEDRQAFIDPPGNQSADIFQRNRIHRFASSAEIGGQRLGEFSRKAQRELLELALRFTSTYQDVPAPQQPRDLALVLTGHQPQLYHPGVWLKNFATSAIAQHVGAWAINLLIDSDTLQSPTLRIPSGTVEQPQVISLAYDATTDEVPFEERTVRDLGCWAGFPCRVRTALASLIGDPLIARIWPWALEAARESGNLGQSLSRARHRLETAWGSESLEVPLSAVAQTRSFIRFAWQILSELARFRQIHNTALAEYRQVHRIRSPIQPLPDLAQEGDWHEAPFWVWSGTQPYRRRLFVRSQSGNLELRDGPKGARVVELRGAADVESIIDQLLPSATNGWKLRPRALLTTMYARCCLSDLFVHGIGGAKYDQVTDLIIDRFLGHRPPDFLTATATVQLPIPHRRVGRREVQEIERELRDLKYVPERFLASQSNLNAEIEPIMAEKQSWIDRTAPTRRGKERFRAIREATSRLQPYVRTRRDELLVEHEQLARAAAQHALLSSREYSFALFPEKFLRPVLLELSSFAL